MTPWSWWAGELDAETYDLSCDAESRDAAIQEALCLMKPGEQFQIIEARSSEDRRHERSGFVPFLRTRNHEIITVGPVVVIDGVREGG